MNIPMFIFSYISKKWVVVMFQSVNLELKLYRNQNLINSRLNGRDTVSERDKTEIITEILGFRFFGMDFGYFG